MSKHEKMTRGGPPEWGLGEGLTTPHCGKLACYEMLHWETVHAPTDNKNDGTKDSFYEDLEHVFNHFPRYHMKILLGYFSGKVGKKDISKAIKRIESLYEISKDNGVRVVNSTTSKKFNHQGYNVPSLQYS
jgi:hypothetical protein